MPTTSFALHPPAAPVSLAVSCAAADRGRVRSLLDARGLRCTTGRSLVLDALLHGVARGEPFTAISLHARLAGQGGEITLPTVYKVVTALRRVGLVEPAPPREEGRGDADDGWPWGHRTVYRLRLP